MTETRPCPHCGTQRREGEAHHCVAAAVAARGMDRLEQSLIDRHKETLMEPVQVDDLSEAACREYLNAAMKKHSEERVFPEWPPAETDPKAEPGVVIISSEALNTEMTKRWTTGDATGWKLTEEAMRILNDNGPTLDDTLDQSEQSHYIWQYDGGFAGRVSFLLADLPRDEREMRRLLHERLQQFGDALMAEWRKQVWDEDA